MRYTKEDSFWKTEIEIYPSDDGVTIIAKYRGDNHPIELDSEDVGELITYLKLVLHNQGKIKD